MIILKILFVFKVGTVILIDAGLSGVLLVGLYSGHKWAYVLTIFFVAVGTVLGFSKSVEHGFMVLILNCLILVPVLICTDYFFPKTKQISEQSPQKRCASDSNKEPHLVLTAIAATILICFFFSCSIVSIRSFTSIIGKWNSEPMVERITLPL